MGWDRFFLNSFWELKSQVDFRHNRNQIKLRLGKGKAIDDDSFWHSIIKQLEVSKLLKHVIG